jgi:hypothetical protein
LCVAKLVLARGRAPIPSDVVSVVAALARIQQAVTAKCHVLHAVGAAVVSVRSVSVVASLVALYGPVSAYRLDSALRVAAVASLGVAVVTFFVRVEHPIAASFRSCVVLLGGVFLCAGIFFLYRGKAVIAPGRQQAQHDVRSCEHDLSKTTCAKIIHGFPP